MKNFAMTGNECRFAQVGTLACSAGKAPLVAEHEVPG